MKSIIFFLLFFSIQIFSQWVQTAGTPPGAGITDLVISGTNIVVTCASYNYPSGQMGGMRFSSDGGNSWQANFNCYTGRKIVTGQNGYVFASAWNYPSETEALYRSTNNGINWSSALYYAGTSNNIFSILVKNNNQTVFIGTRNGVYKSTNGGTLFSSVSSGIPANSWVRDLKMDSLGNMAAATTNGLYISTNSATSWFRATGIPTGDTIVKLQFEYDFTQSKGNGTRLLAGSDDGRLFALLLSGGYQIATFIALFGDDEISDILIKYIQELFYRILVITTFPKNSESEGFNMSIDDGLTWKTHNSGLPPNPKISAATTRFSGNYIRYTISTYENSFNGGKVYRFDTPIGLIPYSNEVPRSFSLFQNYPNPFNPSTKIKFSITKSSEVKLNVFDALGTEISTLVSEQLKPGFYEAEFDGSKYSSGTYFYRLSAGDYTETKKMLLVK
jgi:hypothetical protein